MTVSQKLLALLAVERDAAPTLHVWTVTQPNWGPALSQEEKQLVRTTCPPRSFGRGEHVFRHGEAAEHVRIILQGQIKLTVCDTQGAERVLLVCGPGDIIGENYLMGAGCCAADAVCLTDDTLMCLISQEKFLEIAARVPTAMLAFAGVLAKHNADLQIRLRDMMQPATVRVASTFVDLARRFGTQDGRGLYRLELDVNHTDIASLANTTRVTTTETISRLRKQGLLLGTRGKYQVDVAGLECLMHGERRTPGEVSAGATQPG